MSIAPPTGLFPVLTATGVGSLPGVDVAEATRLVLDELPNFPHLPELPGRGPHAGMVGRAAAVLVDLPVDLQPFGWRFVARPGRDLAHARGELERDLDTLAELGAGYRGALKVQLAGPWTLATRVERTRGGAALADPSAVVDIAMSLAEGLAAQLHSLAARMPGCGLVVQLDEPELPAVLSGRVLGVSGWSRLRQPEENEVVDRLAAVLQAAAAAGRQAGSADSPASVGVHCCAENPPIALLRRAGAQWLSLDLRALNPASDDELGEAVEAGMGLVAGVVPATGDPPPVAAALAPLLSFWQRTGLAAGLLGGVAVTPTCGLAGASPAEARTILRRTREVAAELAERA